MAKSKVTGRRNFLKISAAGAAGMAVTSTIDPIVAAPAASMAVGPGNKWPGRVVVNFNKAAVNNSGIDNQTVIVQMVDDSIVRLTGAASVGAAWKAVFPASLAVTSKIALKVPVGYNGSKSAPNCYVVKGIVAGLQQMDFGGTKFPAANIYIYDKNGSQNYDAVGITTTLLPGVNIVYPSDGSATDGANNMQYAATLSDCNFLINVPSIRGHWAEMGNVTIGFKAHYGTYGPVHGNTAPAYLRDINCTGPVYNKTVLTVVSAIYGQNLGNGPGGTPDLYGTYAKTVDPTSTNNCPTTILMSTDPISAEMQAIKIMRLNQGQAYDTNSMPPYLLISAGIASSYAGTPLTALNIGTLAEASMDVRRIINASPVSAVNPTPESREGVAKIAVSQVKGGNITFIEFVVPDHEIGRSVSIEIHDAKGAMVRTLSQKALGTLNHVSWDEADLRGNVVAKGMYVAHFVSGTERVSAAFTIVR